MLRTTVEGEHFLHRELWRVVEHQVEQAMVTMRGSFYDLLPAKVFCLFTLEAYLNWVGVRLDPKLWADERNYFRKEPFRGLMGKLRKVIELVGIPEAVADKKLYETVKNLKDFRDQISHTQPKPFNHSHDHNDHGRPMLFDRSLEGAVELECVKRTMDDIERIIELIHSYARKKVDDEWFGESALHGPLQYSSSSTSEITG